MTMECNAGNVKVYYEVQGEGTPVLLIHGWGPDHRLMEGCFEPIFRASGKAWMRIYLDLPGMGKSKADPSIVGSDGMLRVVLDFIDAVIPGQRFLLAGQSYGGYLARGVLHERASLIDGLLLLCPAVHQGKDRELEKGVRFSVLERDKALLGSLSEEDRAFFTGEGICTLQNKRVWERYREEVLPGLKITDNSFMNNNIGPRVKFSFDPDELAQPYDKPALLLAGRQDSCVGYRGLWQLAEKYPRASFVLLDRAAHSLQMEQEGLFTAAVGEWLDRVAAEIN